MPGGYWIYQNGKVSAKVNVQVCGMNQKEIVMMKAAFNDLEPPIAPSPPPDAALFDASIIEELVFEPLFYKVWKARTRQARNPHQS